MSCANGRCWLVPVQVLLASLSALAEPAAGPRDQFRWAAWEVPGGVTGEANPLVIVEDEAAESRRVIKTEAGEEKQVSAALQMRVSRRAIAKSPQFVIQVPAFDPREPSREKFIPWKDLVPGVYRLSARVKYSGDANVIGTPIRLAVTALRGGPSVAQDFYSFDLGEEEKFVEISMRYEVDPALLKYLKARSARHSWRYTGFLQEVYPAYRPKVTDEPPPPAGIQITVSLPQTKYSSATGMPPNSVRAVTVDWVRFERIQPSPTITIRHVRAQKRWIRPGDRQTFDVGLGNFHEQPMGRVLVVSLVRGFDERQVIHRDEIGLKPGESKALAIPWATTPDTPIWGYEVRAEIRHGDAVESASHDVFTVHPRVYPVHLMGANYRQPDPFQERENLANLMEVFAATPGDCAQVMPKAEQWLCGMSTVPQSFKIVRATTDYNRSIGVATHMYLFAGGTGTPLMDLYIRRPEWAASRLAATDEVYRIREETSRAIENHDFNTGPFAMPKTPHIEEHLNHWFPELMDRICRDTVEFVRRTGYDGIRFDVGIFAPTAVTTVFGEPLPFKAEDMMPHAARNFEQYRDAIQKEFPDFEFGANMDSWAYLERVGRRNETAPPPETFPEFVAFARAGGMFMDEGTMSAPLFDHYMNRFEDALWGMCQKRTVAREYGGTYQLFSPHRDGHGYFAHDDIYWTILIIASGSHYVGRFSAAPHGEDGPGEFITRFSEFFRSPGLQPLPGAEDQIRVEAPEPLWYADPTVWEDVGNRRRYVIPLINPPVNDRFRRNKANELPSPVDDPFPITVRIPDGYRTAEAWMLTWEPRTSAVRLDVRIDGRSAKVQFPGIKLFRTLVMEFVK